MKTGSANLNFLCNFSQLPLSNISLFTVLFTAYAGFFRFFLACFLVRDMFSSGCKINYPPPPLPLSLSSPLIGTAEKPLLMRSKFRFVFPPFHFQNGGRRINNQHVIVMALGNILLAQGIYKQLGYFGQSLVQMF